MSAENVVVTEDGRNSNGAQVTDVTFQCKHCKTFMEGDVIKCYVCGSEGESLVPVWKEGFKPDDKEMAGVQKVTTFDDMTVQWTQDALDKLEEYPEGHVRRRARARVEKNARIQKIDTISAAFLDTIPILLERSDERSRVACNKLSLLLRSRSFAFPIVRGITPGLRSAVFCCDSPL